MEKKKHPILKLVLILCIIAFCCAAAYLIVKKLRDEEPDPMADIVLAFGKLADKISEARKTASAKIPEVIAIFRQ